VPFSFLLSSAAMAQVAPSHWTGWMVSFMSDTLGAGADAGGAPQLGRAPCSAAERALGEALAATWARWGFDVRREAFACAPHAFLGVIPLTVLAYVRALRLYERRPAAAFASAAAGVALFVAEVVTYHEAVDWTGVFPQQTGACGRSLRAQGFGVGAAAPSPDRAPRAPPLRGQA
jgi:hypothetical protein